MARPNAAILEIADPMVFEPWATGYGPDPADQCQCGSGDPARYCHRDARGQWFAQTPPLLTDSRTGHAHPGCYARATNDCCKKLSNEHWLSRGILEEIADPAVKIAGLDWANGADVDLTPKALGSNILCERHNKALSPLDRTALSVFRAVRRFDKNLKNAVAAQTSELIVTSGERMQLWLLKLAWGCLAADVLPGHERGAGALRTPPLGSDLGEVLFRGARWPSGWGMYGLMMPGMRVSQMGHVQLEAKYGPDRALWSMAVELGPIAFHLCLGVPGHPGWRAVHRPAGVVLKSDLADGQHVIALSWRDGGGDPLFLTWEGEGVAGRSPSGSPR